MKHALARCLATLQVLALGAAASAQVVHVVGPLAGPGVDFTSLPGATAAAASGDVVLVLPGTYPGVANVAKKSLAVVGIPDAGGAAPIFETIAVKNLEPGQSVLVRGLASGATLQPVYPSLLVLNCNGLVLLEDCVFDLEGQIPSTKTESNMVTDSSRVVFSRCVLVGHHGQNALGGTASPGVEALRSTASTVTLDACTVRGGFGATGFPYPFSTLVGPSSAGGPGVSSTGTLTVRGSQVTGGAGGDGANLHGDGNPNCVAPSAGGAAVRIDGVLRGLDSSLTGGAAGEPLCGVAPLPGPEVDLVAGSVIELAGSVGQLELSAVLQDGGSATLSARGLPGDLVIVYHGLGGSGLWLGGQKGTLVPSMPYITLPLGVLPAGGELSLHLALAPVLPPGIEGVLLVNQALFVPPAGKGVLSSATASVLVADAP